MCVVYTLQYRQFCSMNIFFSIVFTMRMLDLLFTAKKLLRFLTQWHFGALEVLAENKGRIREREQEL